MSEHHQKPCYFEGKIIPLRDANINIQTHALQYGTACFGGLRAYYNEKKNNLFLFRPHDHFRRLKKSAHMLQMKLEKTEEELVNLCLDLIRLGEWKQNVYIRPLVYKSALELSPRLHNVKDEFSMYVLPLNDYLDTSKGQRACVSSWNRVHDNEIPPRAKATGSYMNSALAKSEALQNGFDEAIFLDRQGAVSEGSAEIIFIVNDGVLITPDLSSSILDSITRKSVITLAGELGIPVQERRINRTELYNADEAFFAGTGVQIAWISEIDHRMIGSGKPGTITGKLRDAFFTIARGDKAHDWAVPVY